MIEGFDTCAEAPPSGETCTATTSRGVCPRCGRAMLATVSDSLRVVASFACDCGRIDFSFLDLTHCQKTVWHVESAMFALWGERGTAFAAVLLRPHVELFNRWRYG